MNDQDSNDSRTLPPHVARTARIPSEQDVVNALRAWQPHSQSGGQSECVPGNCYCCDAAQELAQNMPFLQVIRSIADQVDEGSTHQLDALISAFAFGLLTRQIMEERVN